MLISLICPSKGRPNNVKRLINNIQNTVEEKVELIFVFDIGEPHQLYEMKELPSNIQICTLNIKHSDFLNKDYYNYGASFGLGKYFWCIGDDVKFLTKSWDKILKEKLEDYLKDKPDRIAYISVSEEKSKAKHPCFPLITSEAFKALDMYFHPDLMSWGADRCLWELYSGVDRILHIPEIEIQHLSYHDGLGEFDKTAKSMKERFFRDPNCHNKVSTNIIPQQIRFLKNYIKKFNKENK